MANVDVPRCCCWGHRCAAVAAALGPGRASGRCRGAFAWRCGTGAGGVLSERRHRLPRPRSTTMVDCRSSHGAEALTWCSSRSSCGVKAPAGERSHRERQPSGAGEFRYYGAFKSGLVTNRASPSADCTTAATAAGFSA